LPVQVNDDRNLEAEADRMGERAASRRVRREDSASPHTHQAVSLHTPRAGANSKAPMQFVIHKGKTHRSKVYGVLANSAWYRLLPSEDYKAFAKLLHQSKRHYTHAEALKKIRKYIKRGDTPPAFDSKKDEKAKRLKRVRDYVNTNEPDEASDAYVRGKYLAEGGQRAYKRQRKQEVSSKAHLDAVKEIDETEPALFEDQTPILTGLTPWQQMVALSESKPKSFDLNIGGEEVTLDSIDFKSNEERKAERNKPAINKAQTFIEQQDSRNSYWRMSDHPKKMKIDNAHKQLRSLEAERDDLSAFTTFSKDALHDLGKFTNKDTFGDETPYAFQEYKGALKPTSAMRKMQMASGYNVLQLAKGVSDVLGTQVGKRPTTTMQQIDTALQNFVNKKDEANYRLLVKEIYRLIRAQTAADYPSDTDTNSEDDYD
jgi:hypothetical protein